MEKVSNIDLNHDGSENYDIFLQLVDQKMNGQLILQTPKFEGYGTYAVDLLESHVRYLQQTS